MISIGNDIIALQLTNSEHTKQEKFYSKLLCKPEIELFKTINSDILSFENFVWLAWSAKESAYKFHKRYNPEILFSPTKLIVRNIQLPAKPNGIEICKEYEDVSFDKEACYCCEVGLDETVFYTISFINDDIIFTIANNTNCFENIWWGIKKIDDGAYETQSETVREFALTRLNKFFININLNIEKADEGYPFVKQIKNLLLSFTHHGNFVAYSFAISAKKIRNNV